MFTGPKKRNWTMSVLPILSLRAPPDAAGADFFFPLLVVNFPNYRGRAELAKTAISTLGELSKWSRAEKGGKIGLETATAAPARPAAAPGAF